MLQVKFQERKQIHHQLGLLHGGARRGGLAAADHDPRRRPRRSAEARDPALLDDGAPLRPGRTCRFSIKFAKTNSKIAEILKICENYSNLIEYY